jgi:Secretion system C-terminal sorting domain
MTLKLNLPGLFTLAFLSLWGSHVSSQYMVRDSMMWTGTTEPGHFFSNGGRYFLKTAKHDSLLDMKIYRVLKSPTDSTFSNWFTNGAMREDSNGKVFFKPIVSWRNWLEFPLYDFGLVVGDTFPNSGNLFGGSEQMPVTRSFDSLVAGKIRKIIDLKKYWYSNEADIRWISGIGAFQLNSLYLQPSYFYLGLVPYLEVDGCGAQGFCHFEKDSLVFQGTNYQGTLSDCFPWNFYGCVGLEKEKLKPLFTIFPIPATSEVNIRFEMVPKDGILIQFYNAVGQRQSFQFDQETQAKINISDFSPGFYLIRIWDGSKSLGTRKIVIR